MYTKTRSVPKVQDLAKAAEVALAFTDPAAPGFDSRRFQFYQVYHQYTAWSRQ